MCLKKISKRKIAKEDITVYKVVTILDGIFYTYFMNSRIEFNKLISSKLVEEFNTFNNVVIEKGLHSFKDIPNDIIFSEDAVLVECIIPKGSVYYEGLFGTTNAFASNQIIYKKIVNFK